MPPRSRRHWGRRRGRGTGRGSRELEALQQGLREEEEARTWKEQECAYASWMSAQGEPLQETAQRSRNILARLFSLLRRLVSF